MRDSLTYAICGLVVLGAAIFDIIAVQHIYF